MLKKVIFAFGLLFFIALVITTVVITRNHHSYSPGRLPTPVAPDNLPKTVLLFYSEQCPHCRKVEAFIQKKGGVNYFGITQKKIGPGMNRQDERLLLGIIKVCKMNPNQIFIPLLWDGKKCMAGDKGVINYLKQQKK